MSELSLTNPVLQSYMLYSAILALKLLCMTFLTGVTRLIRGVYANPEDVKTLGGIVKFDDVNVERIRRAHLNDLENIPAFWVLAALYVTTGPNAVGAEILFRAYTLGRIAHSIVYAVIPLPPWVRGIAFFGPMIIMWYMGIQVIIYYITAI